MPTIAQTAKGSIEYRRVGHGPPVLVLNGGHTDCRSPLGHERFFVAHGYELLIPSRPGYGHTPSAAGRTAEAFADALLALVDQLRLEQVIVVGISAGGRTALQFAGRHAARVAGSSYKTPLPVGAFRRAPPACWRIWGSTHGWNAGPGQPFAG